MYMIASSPDFPQTSPRLGNKTVGYMMQTVGYMMQTVGYMMQTVGYMMQ